MQGQDRHTRRNQLRRAAKTLQQEPVSASGDNADSQSSAASCAYQETARQLGRERVAKVINTEIGGDGARGRGASANAATSATSMDRPSGVPLVQAARTSAGEPRPMSIIFEHIAVGNIQRLAAVDEQTGIEAVIQVPSGIGEQDARDLAARKLRSIIAKRGG